MSKKDQIRMLESDARLVERRNGDRRSVGTLMPLRDGQPLPEGSARARSPREAAARLATASTSRRCGGRRSGALRAARPTRACEFDPSCSSLAVLLLAFRHVLGRPPSIRVLTSLAVFAP